MVSKNEDQNYTIHCVSNDLSGVGYQTGKKDWINKKVAITWKGDTQRIKAFQNGRTRLVIVDNGSDNGLSDDLEA